MNTVTKKLVSVQKRTEQTKKTSELVPNPVTSEQDT
jgi:hypothetical protein